MEFRISADMVCSNPTKLSTGKHGFCLYNQEHNHYKQNHSLGCFLGVTLRIFHKKEDTDLAINHIYGILDYISRLTVVRCVAKKLRSVHPSKRHAVTTASRSRVGTVLQN